MIQRPLRYRVSTIDAGCFASKHWDFDFDATMRQLFDARYLPLLPNPDHSLRPRIADYMRGQIPAI